jgi:hypothetical protein
MTRTRWRRLAPKRRLITGATLFALVGAVLAVVQLIGLLTSWSPVISEQSHPLALGVAVLFTILGFRMRMVGCYVSARGVRNRWEFVTRTVRWADIDRFEIRPSVVAPMRGSPTVLAAWLILKDGRARDTTLWYREPKLDAMDAPINEEHNNIMSPQRFSMAYDRLRELHAQKIS